MKSCLIKLKTKFKQATKGFSLVELIVVIAIMAVMAAVLAPALLGYVEKSRMQKDDSAMDEVVNAIQLSLADQEIYDEALEHSVWDNVSCYIDKKDESAFSANKVTLKAANGDKKEQYMFGDEARLLDETVYYAAGNMRGLTITFSPSESGDTYDFANGILNKFVGRKTGLLSENPELYNRLRSVIGDKLDTTSQTYRNSDYTIFIRVGSTGGSEAVMQDAIQVWGQFNGTNLAEKDHKFELSSGRVVGSAGHNDATNNQTNNENEDVNFSENYVAPLTTISKITWKGLTNFKGDDVWTDGVNTYYSNGSKQYVLKGDTWEAKTWSGLTSFTGKYVWTNGTNIYYSSGSKQYVLNGDTWEAKTWNGLTNFTSSNIWTDGTNYYYSNYSQHYILNGDTWESKTWNGLSEFYGGCIWTDGIHIYYSSSDNIRGNQQYVLNNDNWEVKTWKGSTSFGASAVWFDGSHAYLYYKYILNGDTWEDKTWNGNFKIYRDGIWTDGNDIYYSSGNNHYILSY